MNEWKTSDLSEVNKSKVEGYKAIKPEHGMTIEEVREHSKDRFENNSREPERKTIDGKEHYYDDNGNLYRIDAELSPNTEYTLNGYDYKTDDIGRIASAEGKLYLKNPEKEYNPIKESIQEIGKGYEKDTDDRGHIIGNRFNGAGGLENAVAQDSSINRGAFNRFESELAKEVSAGKDVRVQIEPIYSGESRRPDGIGVSYSISREQSMRIFPNGKG